MVEMIVVIYSTTANFYRGKVIMSLELLSKLWSNVMCCDDGFVVFFCFLYGFCSSRCGRIKNPERKEIKDGRTVAAAEWRMNDE